MRFRTLLAWVIVLGFTVWAAYTMALAGSSYLTAAGVVDHAVSDAMARRKAQIDAGMSREAARDLVASVRSNIVSGARMRGIELTPENLVVTDAREGLRVWAKWSIPVMLYDDTTLFNLPLSVTRSYTH